ncbi:hypothetical protein IFM89_006066 [Coptis chinensis]|uniref:Glycosyl transferase 64 domain-containing protein n=1 Tax=Coptis chinensis TaxID=261450 RepID=A0A835H3S3_9MAGN|nr:hypothetical protein IFM89_006066 [Coptis chinensis]
MGSSSSFCNMTSCFKCWFRWRRAHCFLSATPLFFISSFLILISISTLYAWLSFSHYELRPVSSLGCKEDNEGSWSIGVFYGDSPFTLKPIESKNVWKSENAAWPVANPVITCATVSDAGFPSNFVANPFLYVKEDALYLFYETKNSVTLQGDIGVAKSIDKGATWLHLGIALDEDWHLSNPYVFSYNNQKSSGTNNGQVGIWFSSSPLGPWRLHEKRTNYNSNNSFRLRTGGRTFVYNGSMYRIAQDSGEPYGRRLHAFKVEVLTKDKYKEVEVPLDIEESGKGRNAWNGARYHHLDVKQLSSTEWIGVMDGDRILAGNYVQRCILGSAAFSVMVALIILVGVLLGAIKCILPLSWCQKDSGKRSDAFLTWEHSSLLCSKLRLFCTRLSRTCSLLRGWMKFNIRAGRVVLTSTVLICLALLCTGVKFMYGGNGAEEAYLWKGQYSQFTLLTMTYEARLWNLKMYVKHYSRCSSVKEIVIVWNKGEPPELDDLDSAVPVRIRVENQNSLNNRFKVDPLIKTRAVLELDDDIMMSCHDIERGFRAWREHPERIVGYYPRLVQGSPLSYRNERYARSNKGYNMMLTGAAFIDSTMAFERYWREEAKAGREMVDKYFNCEDVLLNYLYANASSLRTVEYVKPGWVIDMSRFSGVAISGNTKVHYQLRSNCLLKFSEMYGTLDQKWKFSDQ